MKVGSGQGRPLVMNGKILIPVLLACAVFQGCSFFWERPPGPRRSHHKSSKKKIRSPRKKSPHGKKLKKAKLVWPVKGTLTSGYGMRGGKKHDGIDIAAPKGTPIVAVAGGKVIFSGRGPKGYGKMIILKHSSKYVTVYAHNSKNLVSLGDKVKRGKKIGYVGETGRTSGPHLHFEVRVDLMAKDPLLYLPMSKKHKKR